MRLGIKHGGSSKCAALSEARFPNKFLYKLWGLAKPQKAAAPKKASGLDNLTTSFAWIFMYDSIIRGLCIRVNTWCIEILSLYITMEDNKMSAVV